MEIASHFEKLQQYLNSSISESEFVIEKVRMDSQDQWLLREGALTHKSGGFFQVSSIKDEVSQQIICCQHQSALTGLLLHIDKHGECFIMLQAREEPGNSFIGQYGPTVQSTFSNYMRVHGGRAAVHFEEFMIFKEGFNQINYSSQLDLGKRYSHKSKKHAYVVSEKLIEPGLNMIWVSLKTLWTSLLQNNFYNTDLRSLISVFNWDQFLFGNSASSFLQTQADSEFLTYFYNKQTSLNPAKVERLEDNPNIESNEFGFLDTKTGLSVNMYKTTILNREVKMWHQPLLVSPGVGLVRLYMKIEQGEPYFMLSVKNEIGLNQKVAVQPSILIYPEDNHTEQRSQTSNQHIILGEFLQSDEGGRFYQDESYYQLVLIKEDFKLEENQFWVSKAMLKFVLANSDLASIQLRGCANLVINYLNPLTNQALTGGN